MPHHPGNVFLGNTQDIQLYYVYGVFPTTTTLVVMDALREGDAWVGQHPSCQDLEWPMITGGGVKPDGKVSCAHQQSRTSLAVRLQRMHPLGNRQGSPPFLLVPPTRVITISHSPLMACAGPGGAIHPARGECSSRVW